MKKPLRVAALCLGIGSLGAGLTSCDSDSAVQIISIIAQMLQGEVTEYQGTSTSATYYLGANSETLKKVLTTSVSGLYATLRCSSYSSSATISFNDAQINDSITVTGLSLTNLVYSANDSQTLVNFEVGDNSTINGTLTINGKAYTACNLYISKAQATSGQFSLSADIYFGNEERAINYTFTGKQTAQ